MPGYQYNNHDENYKDGKNTINEPRQPGFVTALTSHQIPKLPHLVIYLPQMLNKNSSHTSTQPERWKGFRALTVVTSAILASLNPFKPATLLKARRRSAGLDSYSNSLPRLYTTGKSVSRSNLTNGISVTTRTEMVNIGELLRNEDLATFQ